MALTFWSLWQSKHLLLILLSEGGGLWVVSTGKGLLLPTWSCCIFFLSVFNCLLSGVGSGCQVFLSVLVVCCWLSGVGCRVLTVDFRVSWLVVAVGSWSSGVISGGCLLLLVCAAYRSYFSFSVPSSAYRTEKFLDCLLEITFSLAPAFSSFSGGKKTRMSCIFHPPGKQEATAHVWINCCPYPEDLLLNNLLCKTYYLSSTRA